MRITDITLDRLRLPLDPPFAAAWDPQPRRLFDATVVTVHTDEGVSGVGSGDAMIGFEHHRHLFVGADPLAVARHVRTIETIDFHAARYWPLEAALWDVVGQVAGLPVSRLLGGARDRVPAYASFGELRGPEATVEAATAARERGFRACKIRIARHRLDDGLAGVRAVRAALGDDMQVAVDLNQMWRMSGDIEPALDVPAVRRVAVELAELGVLWLEEPLPQRDVAGLRSLRQATGVRVAGGEMVRTTGEILDLLAADALDVVQTDVVLSAGMHRARLVGELALLQNRWFTPHTWTNGLGLLANLHVVAGVGGGPFVEFPWDPPGWTPQRRDFFLAEPVDVDDAGDLRVPQAPGIGATVSAEAVDRYRV